MNKEAIKSWKESFAAQLLAIRRKVLREKLAAADDTLAAPRVARKNGSDPNHLPKSLRKRAPATKAAARSRYFTGASYASDLRGWWASQNRFTRQVDLAAFIGVDAETFSSWINSKKFPRGRFCDELYRITELECFGPEGRRLARREHREKKVKRYDRATHRRNGHMGRDFQANR
jgi:hypothetical protein